MTEPPADPLFDAAWYRRGCGELGGMDPWAHFRSSHAVRDPNPMFDAAWYLARYPDAGGSGWSALVDYVERGAALGRDPGPMFSTTFYLRNNPDVAAAGANPLRHYLEWGVAEGRDPNPVFDSAWYFGMYPGAAGPGVDARTHYMREGASRGHDPGPDFATTWYLQTYAEAAASGMNPLLHFLSVGARRGFDPSPGFSTSAYVARCPMHGGENPLVHHLLGDPGRGRLVGASARGAEIPISPEAMEAAQALLSASGLGSCVEPPGQMPRRRLAPDRSMRTFRRLYLSLAEAPRTIILVGSIEAVSIPAAILDRCPGVLVIETDTDLPARTEPWRSTERWHSLADLRETLDDAERVRILAALVAAVPPESLVVCGSAAGWELLRRHGPALSATISLGATATVPAGTLPDRLMQDAHAIRPLLSAWHENAAALAGMLAEGAV